MHPIVTPVLTNGQAGVEESDAFVHPYMACKWILTGCDSVTHGLWTYAKSVDAKCILSSSCLETSSGVFRKFV